MTSEKVMESKNLWSYVIAGIVIVVLLLYLFAFQVTAGQEAAVFRFGKLRAVKSTPGLYPMLPYPIETVRRLDTRVRLFDKEVRECLTREKFNINFMVTVGWRISDVGKFVKNFDSVKSAEDRIHSQVNSARNTVLSEFNFYDLVQTDFVAQQKAFSAFENRIKERMSSEISAQDWGVEVPCLYVKNMSFPAEVSEKVFERMKSERMTQAIDIRTRGESEANSIKSLARTKAEKELAIATEAAEKIRGAAEAQAAENYKVFSENPELANFLRKLKSLRMILAESKGTTVVLTTEETPFDLLKEGSKPSATFLRTK